MKRRLLLDIAVLALLFTVRPALAQKARSACDVCHSETEFLRQNASSPEKANAVHVSDAQIAGSAHSKLQCTSCHESFGKFPHKAGATKTCASCHQQQAELYKKGVHSGAKDGAQCSSCHTTHDVRTAAQVESKTGLIAMNANCVSCHQTQTLPGKNPHTNKVLCAGCHAPHDTEPASDRSSRLWANQQLQTCGTCHRKIAAEWSNGDVHAQALLTRRAQKTKPASAFRPPACTDCHGAHGMLATPDSSLEAAGFERCAECHTKTRGPYEDSYHGQAKELGSKKAAACADCHSAHSIRPASDPKSTVAKANLTKTCGTCHKGVTASFTTFDPHVDPHDKSNPLVYWVYKFMTMLLLGTMAFFGLHSLLWLTRLAVDGARKGRGK